MFYEILYRIKYLNKNQSLKYQIMILLMLEHKKARHGSEHIGFYDGGNILYFDAISWIKLKEKLSRLISDNYRDNFLKMKDSYILALLTSDTELYNLNYQETTSGNYILSFEMSDKGYRYQYNGYTRTQEKLQKKANTFIFITLLYYLFSWFFKSPEIKIEDFFNSFFTMLNEFKPFIAGIIGATITIIIYNFNKIRKN